MKGFRKFGYRLLFGLVSTMTLANSAWAASLQENARGHYDLANYLSRTGQHSKAIEEYTAAYRLSPDSLVGRYSLQALSGYRVPTSTKTSSLSQTLIRQSNEIKQRSSIDAEKTIKSRARFTEAKFRQIEANKNADIEDVIANPSYQTALNPYYNNGYGYPGYRHGYLPIGQGIKTVDPVATQARIDTVKNNAELEKRRLAQVASAKEEQLRETADQKARIVEEAAHNLHTQMTGRGVKLDPGNSNLYVRSYK